MRAGQRVHGKPSTQDASATRGGARQQPQPQPPPPPQGLHQQQLQQLLQHRQLQAVAVAVKQEAPEAGFPGEEGAATWSSRQLLKKSIMERRHARGLGDIPGVASSSLSPVQHELTPDELLKKERRKDQNRRAAKKCRLKKKHLQSNIEDDCTQIMEDNKKLEEEKTCLQAEVHSLRQQLNDHLQSGQCRHVTLDNTGHAMAYATSPLPDPQTPASWPTTSTPSPTSPGAEQQLDVSNDLCSQDLRELLSGVDLDSLMNLDSIIEDLGSLDCPAFSQPDANDNFKTLPPESPSPRDRHSVSSVASDWSMMSDQSQGFGLVPSQGGSPTPVRSSCPGRNFLARSMNSTGDWEGDHSSPHGIFQGLVRGVAMDCEMNDMEDDVFTDRSNGL